MSNLGWYQKIVTISKAAGGPEKLVGLLVGGGIVIGSALGTGGTLLWQKVIKPLKTKKIKEITYLENGKIFTVSVDGKDDNGLEFKIGDKYKILNRDADAILIEIIGNKNNPYFVSADFLRTISDFI